MLFPEAKLIEDGGENVDDVINTYRDALLVKDGLVSDDQKENFRAFVRDFMVKETLDQIDDEDMNAFNE